MPDVSPRPSSSEAPSPSALDFFDFTKLYGKETTAAGKKAVTDRFVAVWASRAAAGDLSGYDAQMDFLARLRESEGDAETRLAMMESRAKLQTARAEYDRNFREKASPAAPQVVVVGQPAAAENVERIPANMVVTVTGKIPYKTHINRLQTVVDEYRAVNDSFPLSAGVPTKRTYGTAAVTFTLDTNGILTATSADFSNSGVVDGDGRSVAGGARLANDLLRNPMKQSLRTGGDSFLVISGETPFSSRPYPHRTGTRPDFGR